MIRTRFWLITVISCLIIGQAGFDYHETANSTFPVNKSGCGTLEPIQLNGSNWQIMLQNEWIVEFYTSWCRTCRKFSPDWLNIANSAAEYKVKVGVFDITTSPMLSYRFRGTALPAIYHLYRGELREYSGKLTDEAILEYLRDRLWKYDRPIANWRLSSLVEHLCGLPYFIKISQLFKTIDAILQQEFSMTFWTSYGIFAIASFVVALQVGFVFGVGVDLFNYIRMSKFAQFLMEQRKLFEENDDEEEVYYEAESTSEVVEADDVNSSPRCLQIIRMLCSTDQDEKLKLWSQLFLDKIRNRKPLTFD